jgi:hypothetical protein
MSFTLSRIAALAVLTLATAACDGDEPKAASSTKSEESVRWISTGGDCEDMDRVKNDKEAKENLGFIFCGNAGHTFTGELRCERDYIEVQCR